MGDESVSVSADHAGVDRPSRAPRLGSLPTKLTVRVRNAARTYVTLCARLELVGLACADSDQDVWPTGEQKLLDADTAANCERDSCVVCQILRGHSSG